MLGIVAIPALQIGSSGWSPKTQGIRAEVVHLTPILVLREHLRACWQGCTRLVPFLGWSQR